MGDGPCVSIIIPVYNATDTLYTAVQSILNQTMPDFELLLVDDGSTDGSTALCAALAEQDVRIRALTQSNQGICAARNYGLRTAVGRYITFCDDDDRFLPDALECALQKAQETDADVVRTDYQLFRENRDGLLVEHYHKSGTACVAKKGQGPVQYERFLDASGPQFVWNCLYRRTILQGICFDESCHHGLEDFLFNLVVYKKAATLAYFPKATYVHYERSGSTSQQQTIQAVEGRLGVVPKWAKEEYECVHLWSEERLRMVWPKRKAEIIAFAMRQIRHTQHGTFSYARQAWRMVRQALDLPDLAYKGRLDFLALVRHNKKYAVILFLFQLHLQGFLCLWTPKEERI